MSDDINSNFSLLPGYKATTGQTVLTSQHNPILEDIANAITVRLNRRGNSPMLANLPMGGFKITGAAPGTASTDGATKAQVDAASPIGIVADWAGATAPTGWLLCYGQAVSRATYAALFAVCGTVYGAGDNSTTFNVPDLRGRVTAGKDNMGGAAAGRLTSTTVDGAALGNAGGNQVHVLTQAQLPAIKPAITITDPGHDHPYQKAGVSSNSGEVGSNVGRIYTNGVTSTALTGITAAFASNLGSGAGHHNVQPTLILNKIIKAL